MEDTPLVGVGEEWWEHNNRRRTIAKKGKRCRRARSLEDEQWNRPSFFVLSSVRNFFRNLCPLCNILLQIGILRSTATVCELFDKRRRRRRRRRRREEKEEEERRIVFSGGEKKFGLWRRAHLSLAELKAKIRRGCCLGCLRRGRGGFPECCGEGRSHLVAAFRAATN